MQVKHPVSSWNSSTGFPLRMEQPKVRLRTFPCFLLPPWLYEIFIKKMIFRKGLFLLESL